MFVLSIHSFVPMLLDLRLDDIQSGMAGQAEKETENPLQSIICGRSVHNTRTVKAKLGQMQPLVLFCQMCSLPFVLSHVIGE